MKNNTTTRTDIINKIINYFTDASGQREYGEFNPNREYFRFNANRNLVSSDYKDYSDFLDDEFIEQLHDARGDINAIDENYELSELFDELEQAEED